MAKLEIKLTGDQTWKDYFKVVDERLRTMKVSRGALSRELGMDGAQLSRYFTSDDPNPTGKTVVAIEEALVTLRRREAQRK